LKVEKESIIGNVFVCAVEAVEGLFKKKPKKQLESDFIPFILQELPKKKQTTLEEFRNYWATSTKRMKIKDAMTVFGLLGFIVFCGWVVLNKDILTPPYVTIVRGDSSVTVSGNCTWIKEYYEAKRDEILDDGTGESYRFSLNYTPIELNRVTANLTVETTSTTTVTTSSTTTVTCPTIVCPTVTCTTETTLPPTFRNWVTQMPNEVSHELLNMRADKVPESACVQYGYGICKADYLTYFGLKTTYNGRTIYDTHFYSNVGQSYTNISSDMYCFPKQNGSDFGYSRTKTGFYINGSQWKLNNTYENTTTWNMTTVLQTTSTNHSNYTTWHEFNISTTVLNLSSDDYFIWRT
jgi:hypothetical protein